MPDMREPLAPRGNEVGVLSHLRSASSLSVTDLAALTRLSRPTVEEAASYLVERGLVQRIEPEPEVGRKAGRPAKRFAFRAEAGHILACDMGVELIRMLVATLDGTIIDRAEVTITGATSTAQRFRTAFDAVDELLEAAALARSDIWAVGVATTGIVDASGIVVRSSRLPELTGVNLAQEWAKHFPAATVSVGNDARCAALAEHWKGAAVDVDTSVTVLAGTALAAAITIDGAPYRGWHGASGEVGGIAELGWPRAVTALQTLRSGKDPERMPFRGADVDFADPRASDVLATFIDALAPGLVALVSIIDPPRVIVGGELATAGEALVGPIRGILAERCLFPVEVVPSTLGDDSSLLGALRQALNDVDAVLGRPSAISPDAVLLTRNPW
ncbi:ROK family transcriptional regulator [Microbacterium sp. H1-D42]|uniref:ROK family transcriptional regulator n=1 Tax=Microbacterium sp. H1-D42 TaxID=2925844 RepID=UPI001F530F09|nr:ROK family transcriptional regulator [Microbacterium sp. H1-D42]UNK70812.1 ROK family transcriptional regulator [Microbacterium sp. H1-D42]